MASWIMISWLCEECGAQPETLEDRNEMPVSPQCHAVVGYEENGDEITCTGYLVNRKCSTTSMQTIVRGNSDYAPRQRERLTKREHDHWKRQGRDEAVDRARARAKKESL